MKNAATRLTVGLAAVSAAATLAACSNVQSSGAGTSSATGAASSNGPSWCGPKQVSFALADGFGGNAWRNVVKAEAEDEVKKCSSVTKFSYTDGRGDTQKAISDIRGLVATGVKALVIFPDSGKAMLPAMRAATQQGVAVVPYRVNPGGEAGKDYVDFIDTRFDQVGQLWGNWLKQELNGKGNIVYLGGPAANSQSLTTAEGLTKALEGTDIKLIGQQPFNVTNWDPAKSQSVLSAIIAKYPQIDAVLADDGNALASALAAFDQAGRPVPAIAAQDSNRLGCAFAEIQKKNPDAKMFTVGSQTSMSRLAVQFAVAKATGGKLPDSPLAPQEAFEDSVSGKPNPVRCEKSLPLDGYLSSGLTLDQQIAVLK